MSTHEVRRPSAAIIVIGTIAGLAFLAAGIALFVWYANTAIPRPFPSPHTTFWWGLVHGLLVLPTFVWSLFAHSVTIYQSPNDGNWYNFGYVLGLMIALGSGGRSSRRRRPRR